MFDKEEEIFYTLISNFTNEDNQVIIRKGDNIHPYDFLSYWLSVYCSTCIAVHKTEPLEVDTEMGKGEYYLIIAVFVAEDNPDMVAFFEVPVYELEGAV